MNRKNKNILLCIILVLLIIGTIFTIKSAKDSKTNTSSKPEIRDNINRNNNSSVDNKENNKKQPIEKPDDNNESSQMGKPGMNNDSVSRPDNEDNNKPSQMGKPGMNNDSDRRSNNELQKMDRPNNNQRFNNKKLDTKYYVLFAIEGLGIGLIITYLIMNNINKSINTTDKKLIYVLTSLLLGISIFGASYLVSRNTNNSIKNNDKEIREKKDDDNSVSESATGSKEVNSKEELTDNYSTDKSDTSSILVKDGGNAIISGSTITKSGNSTNTESSDFYGINAGILVTKDSSATIKDANITTDAKGANAVFSTGENSKVVISSSTITTTGESSSRGLDATYGGYIEAFDVTIKTKGGSSATLATDRGEGTVKVTNSKLETNGSGSPLIYSTGNISIDKTTGTSNNSQLVVVEGKNSATVINSKIEASGKGNRGTTDQAGVMIYQSQSGDASEGTGTFTSKDSTLTIQSNSEYYKTAPMFFITNTKAVINLENTELNYGSNILISVKGTSEWGKTNSNGGDVVLNAKSQKLIGDIQIDKLSTLSMNLENSTYKGTINKDNSAKNITLKLDKNSKISLTGDSYITSLDNEVDDNSNIDFNGYKLYVNGKSIK